MAAQLSPLAPERFPALPPLAGCRIAAGAAGVRYAGRTDVCLFAFDAGTTAAGVTTKSLCPSAAVDWCRAALAQGGGSARALVVNSGNANAFTGAAGLVSAKETAEAAARLLGCGPLETYICSTGVIGEPLPHERITAALPSIAGGLDAGAWEAAGRAIMTTDTFPKGATRSATLDGVTVTINGICKGAGMIAPDMATMLAFIVTDAAIAPAALQAMLSGAVGRSFNCVTIDGDTSTSDTALLFATGAAKNPLIADAADPRAAAFISALEDLCRDLAIQIARDGEGVEKLLTVTVAGAVDDGAARRIGLAIANSPLVKTAVAGADANWGRVVMAVGKAGERAERDLLSISFGGVLVAAKGQRVDGYDEAPVAAHMKGRDVRIAVDIGLGSGQATVWSCDLTHAYIDINADYRS